MTSRGLYIVIEGPEGVGKTTQVELLANKLLEQGRMVRIAREPDSQSELTARAIRRLTQDPRYPMNTKTEVLLYNAARSQSLDVIKKSVEAGIDCIVDRSFLTTLGIQFYGRGDVKDYEAINKIISFAVGDMYPDVLLILDAPVDTLMERFKHRYHGERFDNLDRDFLERVRNGYLTEAFKRAIPVLDAMKAPEEIAADILTHIKYAREAATDRPMQDEGSASNTNESKLLETVPEPVLAKSTLTYLAVTKCFTNSDPSSISYKLPDLISYYRPANFGKKVLSAYDVIVKKILENYETATTDLSKHLATRALREHKPFKVEKLLSQSQTVCRNLLPACAFVKLDIKTTTNDVPEEISPTLQDPDIVKLLPTIDADQPKPGVRLLSHTPRNEFEVLERVIYSQSDQSESSIRQLTDELKYDQKAELLKKNIAVSTLQSVVYDWEVIGEFSQYFDLLASAKCEQVTAQKLSPRYGFETPELIEEAGIDDLYQQSFDLSLELYSLLQSGGFESQAEYGALLGHRMRFEVSINLDELKKLLASRPTTNLKALLQEMKHQAKNVHPLLWGS